MFVKIDGEGPLYQQVYDSLRAGILEGRLAPGTRLPSTRALARDAGVSRTTVLLAYEQLLAEGYVTGRAGSGTYVAPELPDASPKPPPPEVCRRKAAAALSAYGRRAVGSALVPVSRRLAMRYDFRYGLPPVEEFPHEAWRRLLSRRARAASLRSLQYGPPEGYEPLRREIAAYLRRARAVSCEPEQVIVVNGSQQALDLAARVLVDAGDRVVVEEPQYQGARRIFLAVGARLVPALVDLEGIDAAAFPPEADSAKLAYVTPSHQFPTGAIMTLPRRLALLAWAEASGAYIFEDDYDSEFRYEGRPVESVQGLDRAGRVIYAGTFSKVLFPSLRIGYLVLPEALVEPFTAAKWLSDRHTPTLEQETLTDFIAEGHFERHLRRSRTRNGLRRAALLDALEECLGDGLDVWGANAGIHLLAWLRHVPHARLDEVVAAAAHAGVGIYPVDPYYLGAPPSAGLVLGYASLSEREIRAGVRLLAKTLSQ